MFRLLAVLLFLIVTASVQADDWQDSPAVADLFARAGLRGTFVLYDVQRGRLTGYDRERAQTRYVPASTFKIANTLIGLSSGAVASVDEVFPYDGKARLFKSWEREMGLREAIKVSNVPVYQELARRIGLARMRAGLARLDYGNGEIGAVVERFWLDGPLTISAVEQARFVARLARGELPLERAIQASVRDILVNEKGENWTLYAKTGWLMERQPQLGWWVGWVEKNGQTYAFALNIDMAGEADAAKRIELGKAALRALGVI